MYESLLFDNKVAGSMNTYFLKHQGTAVFLLWLFIYRLYSFMLKANKIR